MSEIEKNTLGEPMLCAECGEPLERPFVRVETRVMLEKRGFAEYSQSSGVRNFHFDCLTDERKFSGVVTPRREELAK